MNYHDLLEMYFERSVALQWYWTLYVLVIGGVIGFSTFRQRPELVTTILVAILYVGFAYKNWGAIEATAREREAILTAIRKYPETELDAVPVKRVRPLLEPTMPSYDVEGARYFHLGCDLLTIAYLAAKEWRRRTPQRLPEKKAT